MHPRRDSTSHAPRPARLEYSSGLDDASMATTTSTLSELTRTPTPPSNGSNYLTASEGTSGSASVTEPSSPACEPRDDSGHHKAVYRDASALPRELKLRCHIHLEEQYCELSPVNARAVL